MINDFNKAQKLSEYSVYKWQEEQFIENLSIVMKTAKFSVQEITTKNKDKVYLVPEEFYQAVMGLICRAEEESK